MTSIPKNVYIDKLDINKYDNTYHNTIKMKHPDLKSSTYINSSKEINIVKIVNLKLVILLEYRNIEIFFQDIALQIGLKKFL